MPIHIGNIIHEKVKKSTLSVKEIALAINRSENTLYDFYKRESIDTALLLKLSEILEFNFFSVFDEEEPIKSMRENQIAELTNEIKELKIQLKSKNEFIAELKERIEIQKDILVKDRNDKPRKK